MDVSLDWDDVPLAVLPRIVHLRLRRQSQCHHRRSAFSPCRLRTLRSVSFVVERMSYLDHLRTLDFVSSVVEKSKSYLQIVD